MNNKKLSYYDDFVEKNSPAENLPKLINLDKFALSERINCTTDILDNAITEGFGDKTAVITANRSYTYQELLDKSNQIANYLVHDLGVLSGNRVLLCSPNNFMMAASWLGIVKAGAVAVAVLPTLEPQGIVKVVQKAQIKFALCDDRFEERFASVKQTTSILTHVVAFDANLATHARLSNQSTKFNNVDTAANDCCLIGFTSGTTTGNPKAVIHLHRDMLIACQAAGQRTFKITEKDTLIGSPSMAFGFGLGSLLLSALYCRATTVLLESPTPNELLQNIDRCQPTVLFTSPNAYKAMADDCDNYDISNLRLCVSGGEHIMPSIWQAWKDKTNISIYEGIGCTEMLFLFLGPDIDDIQPGRIGKPIFGYEAKVVDSQGDNLPANTIGRLAVRGPLGCHYLSGEQQKKYVINGWNITDDCVLMDDNGHFWCHGRAENEFHSDSGRLNLLEVEYTLSNHKAVAECAVVKSKQKPTIQAYAILKKNVSTDKAELKAHIKMTMGDKYCPDSILFVDVFPRTASGKIQRHKLQD